MDTQDQNQFQIPIEELQYEVVKMGSGLAVKMSFCVGSDADGKPSLVTDFPLFPLTEGSKFSVSKHARFVLNSPYRLEELKAKIQGGGCAPTMACDIKLAGVSFSKDYLVILNAESK